MTSLAVIVSTYNNPRALELVLAGLERQTRPPQEVLIADDGSGAETRGAHRVAGRAGSRIRRAASGIRDEGFRKCRILNQASSPRRAEYLVFFDGDCVPAGTLSRGARGARGASIATSAAAR